MDDIERTAYLIKATVKAEVLWRREVEGRVSFLIERYLCKSGDRLLPVTPCLGVGIQLGGKKVSALNLQLPAANEVISIPGVTLVIPGLKESHWKIRGTLDFVMIYFRGKTQQKLRSLMKERPYPLGLKDSLSGALAKQIAVFLGSELFERDEHVASLANSLVYQLTYMLANPEAHRAEDVVGSRYPFVQEIIAYINDHLQEKLSVKLLSEKVGLQQSYFREVFKRVTGSSLHRYIMKARLNKAHELLATTQIPIASLAENLGFNSQGHFSMAFKNYYGVSPGQFRRFELKGSR